MTKLLRSLIGIALCLSACCCSVMAIETGNSYILDDAGGGHIPISSLYKISAVYNAQSGLDIQGAKGLFVSGSGTIYIADTGNNRVLILDTQGKVIHEISEGDGLPLDTPQGVFVDSEEQLYIADTGNKRILVCDKDGKVLRVYGKPDTDMLEDSYDFSPTQVVVNENGFLYAVMGKDLMAIGADGSFKGFIGAEKLGFSLSDFIIQRFASEEQKQKITKREPSSINNICYYDQFIYATSASDTGQLRKINLSGDNIFPKKKYGELIAMEETSWSPFRYTNPQFGSVAVDPNGFICMAENLESKIYQYDMNGNLIGIFGGKGDHVGSFGNISAICFDSTGNLYVLDETQNNLQIFHLSSFAQNVHTAITHYNQGQYTQAQQYWQLVADANSNYAMAHKGLGEIAYQQKDFEESMKQFKLAEDTEGYGRAFAKYRHALFKEHFTLVACGIVVLLVGLFFLIKFIIQYSRRLSKEYFKFDWS